jgi:hypothetical protein
MKTIKRIALILTLALPFASCHKAEVEKSRNAFILAGQNDTEVLSRDFVPNLQMELTNEKIGSVPTSVYSGELFLDLNLDGKNDMRFYSYYGMGHPMAFVTPSEGSLIYDISPESTIDICFEPLHLNDSVNVNLSWKKLIVQNTLSSYTPEWYSSPEIKDNRWTESDLYFGYRMILKADTIYGWIGIQITDYYKLTIRDIGLAK